MPGGAQAYFLEAFRLQERGRGYSAAKSGRRFAVTHQTPGTTIAGQTSFSATTPTFMFYQSAGPRRLVLATLGLTQAGSLAGGPVNVVVAIDRTNRYSAGGTIITPQNLLADSTDANDANTPGFTFRFNPTATAPGVAADVPRYLYSWVLTPSVSAPQPFCLDFLDGLVIGTTGSLLIYTWAAVTAPSWQLAFEILEED